MTNYTYIEWNASENEIIGHAVVNHKAFLGIALYITRNGEDFDCTIYVDQNDPLERTFSTVTEAKKWAEGIVKGMGLFR